MEWSDNGKPNSQQNIELDFALVIVIIFMILYFTYNSMKEAFVTIITVPLP
jgi:Cu(I)/Ag(I) efflux system membrane protein CusA/SilA